MKRIVVVFFVILTAVVSVEAAQLIVPTDYPNVSDALAASVAGDKVVILPGCYTDPRFWNSPDNVTIDGLEESAVTYAVPSCYGQTDAAVILHSGCSLLNLHIVAPNNSKRVVYIPVQASNVLIDSVVISGVHENGVKFDSGSSGTMSQCTLIGTSGQDSMGVSGSSEKIVTNCIVVNFFYGIYGSATETFNLFWNVDYPRGYGDYEPDSTDIVNIADPMLDPVTFAPGYGSLAVDSGDPGYSDPDGTNIDRGGVYRSQILYTLEFLADPKDAVAIGLPRRQSLPPRMFHAGDRFVLASRMVKTQNPPFMASESTSAYLLLDVYGAYYWAPNWTTEFTYESLLVTDGLDEQTTVFDFIWPEVDGSASGLLFWATTITDNDSWVGPVACLEFGYE